MAGFNFFLTAMCGLFAFIAALLLTLSLTRMVRGQGERAAVYFGLTILSCAVAAGFYFFRRLL